MLSFISFFIYFFVVAVGKRKKLNVNLLNSENPSETEAESDIFGHAYIIAFDWSIPKKRFSLPLQFLMFDIFALCVAFNPYNGKKCFIVK